MPGRCPSASEISRNVKHFETWSLYQGCEQVCINDLPAHLKEDVDRVMDVTARIPRSWIKGSCPSGKATSSSSSSCDTHVNQLAIPGFLQFLTTAYDQSPSMFRDDEEDDDTDLAEAQELYGELLVAFSAWKRLRKMCESKEKWSEADFVQNMYNILRSPAIASSTLRAHCSISLPQPTTLPSKSAIAATRILNAKTVSPDGAIFLPFSLAHPLSHSSSSHYKSLKRLVPFAKKSLRSTTTTTTFRDQATPRAHLPDTEGFEFVSCLWEDKKPVHQLLEDAYRQNRMSTAGALRHLHAFRIDAPVFGLVWANGNVQVHVDWWQHHDSNKQSLRSGGRDRASRTSTPVISSALYANPATEDSENGWVLERPGHLLHVYFLLRNIDNWTTTRFRDRIVSGLEAFSQLVEEDPGAFRCWKRDATVRATKVATSTHGDKENENVISLTSTTTSSTNTATETPVKAVKRKKAKQK